MAFAIEISFIIICKSTYASGKVLSLAAVNGLLKNVTRYPLSKRYHIQAWRCH